MEDAQLLEELYEVIKQNRQQDFPRIIEQQASYPYLYHLSEVRGNLVDWLPLERGMRVLERSAECGALTGSLLKKTGQVTCVAETPEHAKLIRTRWGEEESGLCVLTETEWQQGEHGTFDAILLAGNVWRYRDELPALAGRLSDRGRLILADANRLGLRYLAGCQEEYEGGYFTGIEGRFAGRARSFSRSEYESMLREAGLAGWECYYPYPDHIFPTAIYSQGWLPGKGELVGNRRNFAKDRIQLFDEGMAYDGLLAEGVYGTFANSFLMIADKGSYRPKERMLYAKFSGERNRRFAVRTEIRENAAGEKRVQKEALYREGIAHTGQMCDRYLQLSEAYADSGIDFCRCERHGQGAELAFIRGRTLADILSEAAGRWDRAVVEQILREYIRRIGASGGTVPFVRTEEFAQVFGPDMPDEGMACARVSDIDLIFSNILLPENTEWEPDALWTVIDYEWTFSFPVPKAFLLYRGLYFAYHQLLGGMGWGQQELFDMAQITEEQAKIFAAMEIRFQSYLGTGTLSVRNMQRKLGTRIVPLRELLEAADGRTAAGMPEAEWLKVRRLRYHIDRVEYQDGSVICSGWAFAKVKDGRCLPVDICVKDAQGHTMPADVTRTERADVARQLNIRAVTHPVWGFDCVWLAQPKTRWSIRFSLGNLCKVYEH